MLRGCRFIILALVGLILLGAGEPRKPDAQPKQATEQGEIAKSLQEISATLERAQQADETTKPCAPEQPNRNSDLCAQWKAADAASSAANAAWKQYYAALFGLLLGAITMAAAIAAALYARRAAVATEDTVEIAKTAASEAGNALEIAERNAGAAVKLADQSEKTAERQLRAYLSTQKVVFEINWDAPDEVPRRALLAELLNNGQTPCVVKKTIVIAHWQSGDKTSIKILNNDGEVNFECHKNLPIWMRFELPESFDGSEVPGKLNCFGFISYLDVFGKNHAAQLSFISPEQMAYSEIDEGTRFVAQSVVTVKDVQSEIAKRADTEKKKDGAKK